MRELQLQVVTDRRRVLLGGGLVLAVALAPRRAFAQEVIDRRGPQPVSNDQIASVAGRGFLGFSPDAFIRISPRNEISLILPNVEMGQGTYTGEAMLIAEELEVRLDQVRIVPAPPDDALYTQPLLQFQATGGSTSIRGTWEPLRKAGAMARTLLTAAAAARWHARIEECEAQDGRIVHRPTQRSLTYGAVAEAAGKLPRPKEVPLKDPARFRLIGQPVQRVDTPSKTDGSTRYGIDIAVPGMKHAAVIGCPVLGGTVRAVDDAAALRMPGVLQVVRLPDAVAVVADDHWSAQQAVDALRIEWAPGENVNVSTQSLRSDMERTHARSEAAVAVDEGDAPTALSRARDRIEATYVQPFLCHAPLEPQAAVVHFTGSAAQVWCGTQVPSFARTAAAKAMGLDAERVTLHNQLIGGAFGRKLETDYVAQAAAIARQCRWPVKLTWSREQDMRHDNYRPMYLDTVTAALGEDGRPAAWHHRVTAASVTARYAPAGMRPNGVDPDAVEEAEDPIYGRFPRMRVEYQQWKPPPGLVVSWWRGVGPTHSIFVVESFIDELAHAARRDPLAYRRDLLRAQPRALAVLDEAVRAAEWERALPARHARGIAVQKSFGSFLAVVVELSVDDAGEIVLHRISAAVDCGIAINPRLVAQQIEGGILFGLSAALFNEITFTGGAVDQSNFNDYRMLRINETPPVEVRHVRTNHPPGGIGEAGTTAAAPALTNALFAATGVRIRELPVKRELLRRS